MPSRAEKRARIKHHEMSQSNAVIDLKRDADELAAAVRALKGTAAASLAERLRTVLRDGEDLPDVELVFELLGRLVEKERHRVEEADGDRWVRGMDLYCLRLDCRKAKDELYAEASWIRGALVELLGSKRCRQLFGLAARTPRGAAELAEEVERLVRRLERPGLRLPAPPGLRADPASWTSILKPRLARLTALLAEIDAAEAGSQGRAHEERRIQASCRKTHLLVARSLEALVTLAGEERLARSLRSEARRRAARKGERRRNAAVVAGTVLKPALASIFEWLRRLFGRLWSSAGSLTRGISRIPGFFRWQRGSKRPETPLPALARRL